MNNVDEFYSRHVSEYGVTPEEYQRMRKLYHALNEIPEISSLPMNAHDHPTRIWINMYGVQALITYCIDDNLYMLYNWTVFEEALDEEATWYFANESIIPCDNITHLCEMIKQIANIYAVLHSRNPNPAFVDEYAVMTTI